MEDKALARSTRTLATWMVVCTMALLSPIAWATIIGSLPYTLTNGTTADATHVMANYQKIIDDVNANAAQNGANSDITALLGLTTPLAPASGGTNHFPGGTTTGSANAQALATTVPDTFTLTAGNSVTFTAGFTNTSATTLNVNATGPTNVFKTTTAGPVALTGGEIVANNKVTAIYDGTQFQIVAPRPQFGSLTDLASAGTTDLGTIPSHNINVTGTTSITSFGSSASTTDPVYRITFAGALTLTHNGTSLILPGGANIATAANATAEALYLGSGNWRVLQYQQPAIYPGTGQLARINVYTANDTWTLGAGERSVRFECGGGGGGGGGAGNTGANQVSMGGGGGAGGYSDIYTTAPAASYVITIGAAGSASASAAGGNGGNTTVGALLTCNGGTGGTYYAPANNAGVAAGSAGGSASGGTRNLTGGTGSGGVGLIGTSAAAWTVWGGNGGAHQLGHLGPGGTAPYTAGGADDSGKDARGCGAGGGGAASHDTNGGARAGGVGATGCVIAYTYY